MTATDVKENKALKGLFSAESNRMNSEHHEAALKVHICIEASVHTGYTCSYTVSKCIPFLSNTSYVNYQEHQHNLQKH